MHELGLATEILEVAQEAAGPGRAIQAVHVTMGHSGHLDADTLSHAFTMATTGTEAAGATLVIDRPAVTCPECGDDVVAGEWPTTCRCGAVLLTAGAPELAVTGVDVG